MDPCRDLGDYGTGKCLLSPGAIVHVMWSLVQFIQGPGLHAYCSVVASN